MNPKVLIAGIGNIFLGDDGFGPEVVQRLAQRTVPDAVRVHDFGIRSYDLAYAIMEDWDLIILVDAVPRGGEPGTIYIIEPDLNADQATVAPAGFDAHSMNPVAVLQLVRALGGHVKRMLVVGCEPDVADADGDGQMRLSDPVRAAIDESIRVIEDMLTRARSGNAIVET